MKSLIRNTGAENRTAAQCCAKISSIIAGCHD
jgi:hypothetical protein